MGVFIINTGMLLNTQASLKSSAAILGVRMLATRARGRHRGLWRGRKADTAIFGVGTGGEIPTFERCPPNARTAPTGTNPVRSCEECSFLELFWRARARAARSCLQQPLLHKTSNRRADEGSSKDDDGDTKYRAQKHAWAGEKPW